MGGADRHEFLIALRHLDRGDLCFHGFVARWVLRRWAAGYILRSKSLWEPPHLEYDQVPM